MSTNPKLEPGQRAYEAWANEAGVPTGWYSVAEGARATWRVVEQACAIPAESEERERCQVHEPDADDDGFGRCTCGAGSDEGCGGPHDHMPPCPASRPRKPPSADKSAPVDRAAWAILTELEELICSAAPLTWSGGHPEAYEWEQRAEKLLAKVVALRSRTLPESVRSEIGEAPKGDSGDGWVSVAERLPEEGKLVLVVESGWAEPAIGCLHPDGVWNAEDDADSPLEVTHWRPLPPPPSDGKEPSRG